MICDGHVIDALGQVLVACFEGCLCLLMHDVYASDSLGQVLVGASMAEDQIRALFC